MLRVDRGAARSVSCERADGGVVADDLDRFFRDVGGDDFVNRACGDIGSGSLALLRMTFLSSNQKVPGCGFEGGLVHEREVAAFSRDESVRHVGGLEAEGAAAGHGVDEGDG